MACFDYGAAAELFPGRHKNEDDRSRDVYEICRSGRGNPLRS